eukprot:2609653-Amphidinium_carterae.1
MPPLGSRRDVCPDLKRIEHASNCDRRGTGRLPHTSGFGRVVEGGFEDTRASSSVVQFADRQSHAVPNSLGHSKLGLEKQCCVWQDDFFNLELESHDEAEHLRQATQCAEEMDHEIHTHYQEIAAEWEARAHSEAISASEVREALEAQMSCVRRASLTWGLDTDFSRAHRVMQGGQRVSSQDPAPKLRLPGERLACVMPILDAVCTHWSHPC